MTDGRGGVARCGKGKLGCAGLRLPYCDEDWRGTEQNVNCLIIYLCWLKKLIQTTIFVNRRHLRWRLEVSESKCAYMQIFHICARYLLTFTWINGVINARIQIWPGDEEHCVSKEKMPAPAPAAVTRGSTWEVWLHRGPSLRQSENFGFRGNITLKII